MNSGRARDARPSLVATLLGELEVLVNGVPVATGHTRQRSVLVVLLVEANRVVPVDVLVERVWGDHPPVRARSVLRTYLSHLRRALAPTGVTITWRDTGYLLAADPDTIDLHRFRRLLSGARAQRDPWCALALAEEALALWRGEPLAELDTPWAEAARERLRRERAAVEADRVDWALACGRHDEVVPGLVARAAEEPLDERLAGQVMVALYRSGRPADALEHYRCTRQRLAEELGTDPGPALQRLHQRILTADPTLATARPTPRREAGPTAVPRQLPAVPAPFVGRHDELDRLDAALLGSPDTAATVVVSAVAGAGGIGKTWLALHWAHRHADRFPDGQLFVDLRGFSPEGRPMDSAAVVRGFLDVLGVRGDRLPVDRHAQAALFRGLVAGRRMLLVLDNAVDTEQVTPLLPGGDTCTVLVTSRRSLSGLITAHGAHHLTLGVLSDDEAHALLTGRLGATRTSAEPAAVNELIALCGGFPLALSVIAAHADTRPRLTLAALAAELRDLGLEALDDDDHVASLPAVLSWSYRSLTPEQATTLALLGIAPGPDIGLPAAVALTGLSPVETRRALRGLVQASLVTEDADGRYRMHDLIRRHAAEKARQHIGDADRDAALRRVVDHYLHTAHTAERLLNPHRAPIRLPAPAAGHHPHPLGDAAAALAWFTAEHPVLLATQQLAARLGWHTPAWQLAWTLDTFHNRRGHRHDKLAVWRVGLEAAAHDDDPAVRVLAHRMFGNAAANAGAPDEAVEHLVKALDLAEATGDRLVQAQTHQTLAWVLERQRHHQRALEHITRALHLFRGMDEPVWEARALNAAGWLRAQLGDYETAREQCQAALDLVRRHHERTEEAGALDSLGLIAHRTGQHARALEHYRQALTLYRALGYTYYEAETLDRAGHPQQALGRHDEARASWRRALELYRQQERDDDAERVRRQLDALDRANGDQPAEPRG